MLSSIAILGDIPIQSRICAKADLVLPAAGGLDMSRFARHALTIQQEDDTDILHMAAAVMLFDGRSNESVFEMMQSEGVFPRLVELIRDSQNDDNGLHKLLLELLFEMSRVQRLERDDLSKFVRDCIQLQPLTWPSDR